MYSCCFECSKFLRCKLDVVSSDSRVLKLAINSRTIDCNEKSMIIDCNKKGRTRRILLSFHHVSSGSKHGSDATGLLVA